MATTTVIVRIRFRAHPAQSLTISDIRLHDYDYDLFVSLVHGKLCSYIDSWYGARFAKILQNRLTLIDHAEIEAVVRHVLKNGLDCVVDRLEDLDRRFIDNPNYWFTV